MEFVTTVGDVPPATVLYQTETVHNQDIKITFRSLTLKQTSNMKKLFLALAVISGLTVSSAKAQKMIRFGFKGGANLGKIDGTGYDGAFKLGWHWAASHRSTS